MDKITIKNISYATVSIYVPDIKFNRTLVPNRVISVDKDTYEELTFDTGFNALVRNHYIQVSGIEEDEAVEKIESVYDTQVIAEMLDSKNITAFANFIPTAAPAEKEAAVQLAVEKGITHPGFVELIKKYCDRDVISLINMKHESEE